MKKEFIRKRVERRLRRIAEAEKITFNEVYKIFRSQFLFTKQTIEGLDKEWLRTTSEEEIKELVFNFIYIGKIHSSKRLQDYGNNKNNLKGEKNGKKGNTNQEDQSSTS